MARTPGSNTLLYYKLQDTTEEIGGYNLNATGGTFEKPDGCLFECAKIAQSVYYSNQKLPDSYLPRGSAARTYSVWARIDSLPKTRGYIFGGYYNTNSEHTKIWVEQGSSEITFNGKTTPYVLGNWCNLIYTYTGTQEILYYNGQLIGTTTTSINTYYRNIVYVGVNSSGTASNWYRNGYVSNAIVENKARTATEVQSYYNDTAWQYGLAPKPTILYGGSPIKEMYYGTGVDVWDTQGPCPDGYHIPTTDEWKAVYNALVALGEDRSVDFYADLKLPLGGYRSAVSSKSDSSSYGYYWSSTAYDNSTQSRHVRFNSTDIRVTSASIRNMGYSIRPFKNSPVKPDAGWTIKHAGSGGAGVYHNASLGLISISSNGTTWYTIADKNLGATTVWNYGTTSLNEDNCGKFYQWGNNYGFPWTGNDISKTSPSEVNASAYGPGNYYNSDTWITDYAGNAWDSSDNRNLWGGVSQGVSPGVIAKKIKEVYYGSTKIRPTGYDENSILNAINNSDTTKLDEITQNGEYLSILVGSTSCTTAFIGKNTLLQTYVAKMWNTVTTDTAHFSLVGNTYGDDSWTQMVTNAATANSITFFSGGYYSSSSNYGWMKHRDGTVAKIGQKGGAKPQSVTTSNVEGVSFVGATFGQCGSSTSTTTSGDGYAAGATYKVL